MHVNVACDRPLNRMENINSTLVLIKLMKDVEKMKNEIERVTTNCFKISEGFAMHQTYVSINC